MLSLPVSLVDIEPFDAWVFRVAGWATITVAIVGLVASLFVPMAYCRYGCPTGALLKFLQVSLAQRALDDAGLGSGRARGTGRRLVIHMNTNDVQGRRGSVWVFTSRVSCGVSGPRTVVSPFTRLLGVDRGPLFDCMWFGVEFALHRCYEFMVAGANCLVRES